MFTEKRIDATKTIQRFYRKYKIRKQKTAKISNFDILDTNTKVLNSNSSYSVKDLPTYIDHSTNTENPMITSNGVNSIFNTKYNLTMEHTYNSKFVSNKLKSFPMTFMSVLRYKQHTRKMYDDETENDTKLTRTDHNHIDFISNDLPTTEKSTEFKFKFQKDLNSEIFFKKQFSQGYINDQNFLVDENNQPIKDTLSEPVNQNYFLINFHFIS